MKSTITYNLPEDNAEFFRAIFADSMASALWDIEQYLRKVDKYETGDTIEQIRTEFYDILTRHDINRDNLIK